MSKLINEYIDNTSKNFLMAVADQLDGDTVKFLQSGNLAFEDGVFYVKKEVTGMSGINDLSLRSDSEEVGIRNFDRSALPALQNLILKKVIVRYATHATETDGAKLAFSSKKPGTAIPGLQNGEIVIEQDDKPLLRMPVSQFFASADYDDVSKEGYALDNWRLIKAERQFNIKLVVANGESVAISTEKHHLEVILVGTKTRKR